LGTRRRRQRVLSRAVLLPHLGRLAAGLHFRACVLSPTHPPTNPSTQACSSLSGWGSGSWRPRACPILSCAPTASQTVRRHADAPARPAPACRHAHAHAHGPATQRYAAAPTLLLAAAAAATPVHLRLCGPGGPAPLLAPQTLTNTHAPNLAGPYTSYDLNTLLKNTSGSRQDITLSLRDDLLGETSRIAGGQGGGLGSRKWGVLVALHDAVRFWPGMAPLRLRCCGTAILLVGWV
jgi:hypothetical protein